MNGFDKLINACDSGIAKYSEYLTMLHKLIEFQNLLRKEIIDIVNEEDLKCFDEMEHFNNYKGYIIISLLELSVINKNLCLVKTDWEKIFFIKHGYLTIHETINKLKPQKGISYVQQTIDKKYPLLKEKFDDVITKIIDFKKDKHYNKIEEARHQIAGHIDKKLNAYYDTAFSLDGEEAGKIISEFLKLLEGMYNVIDQYNIIANKVLIQINAKIKNTNNLLN